MRLSAGPCWTGLDPHILLKIGRSCLGVRSTSTMKKQIATDWRHYPSAELSCSVPAGGGTLPELTSGTSRPIRPLGVARMNASR
jgi:hypothetical protein